MLYAILCYNYEDVVCSWSKEEDDAVMAKLDVVHERLAKAGKLGPVVRLMPTTAATTLRKDQEPPLVIDGPFAETKEQLLGFYRRRLRVARRGARASPASSAAPIPAAPTRSGPSRLYLARGARRHVTDADLAWIDAALTAARPQAVGALLRYFRDLDTAEEAFQEACLRALKNWPANGPPRDPAAWLIFVGRNARARRGARAAGASRPLPADEIISDLDDAEAALAERLDDAHYRDDILRLLFICCHPDLPATQQIALALRIVSRPVGRADRARLPGRARARWSSASPAPSAASRRRGVPFETPGAVERAERGSPPSRP